MEKIKKIVSSGRSHGNEYLDQRSASHRQGGVSTSDSTGPGSTQAGGATTGNTTTGYPRDTSTAGYTTSGYNNAGNTSAGLASTGNAQGSTAARNISSYGNSGTTASGPTTTSYPTTTGYTTTGNSAPVTTGSAYSRDSARAGQDASGYNPTRNTGVGNHGSGYTASGDTTTQRGTMENATGFDADGRRLSKGPNQDTGITSGLGSATTSGSGNTHVEDGLTRGFQTTGATGNTVDTSGAQTGNLSGRDNTGTNTGYQNTSTNAGSAGSHLTRDAAAVGTGGAAAEGTHLHHQTLKDTETGGNTTGTSHRLGHETVAAGASGQGSHLHRQSGRENLGSDAGYPTSSGEPSSGHHLGRDAAVVGGVGAAGAGVYHYRENEREASSNAGYTGNTSSGASGAYTGPYGTAIPGPHAVNAANLLDPAVNTTGKGHIEDSHYHSRSRGGGGEAADKFHDSKSKKNNGGGAGATTVQSSKKVKNQGSGAGTTTSSSDTDPSTGRHLGKDTAMGAGLVGAGAGAAGIAGHEYRKNESGTGAESGTTTGDFGAKSGSTASTGPTSGAYDTTTGSSGHNTGRNAAIGAAGLGAGGLGVAGLGAGAHGRDESGYAATSDTARESSMEGPAPHTAGPHKYDWLNKLDPRVDANPETGHPSATDTTSGSAEGGQHYGRDSAAGAGIGGIGGAAYGAAKQSHTKTDSGVAGLTPTTAQDPYDSKTTGTSGQNYGSQYTTDQKTSGTTASSTTGYQGTGTGRGPQTALTTDQASGHHYGRDAAIAGGGVATLGGAAALEEQQYQKQERTMPLVNKGTASDANEKFQGVPSTTGTTGTTGTSDTTDKTRSLGTNDPYQYDNYGTGTSSLPDRTIEQHHYGRDAAIGAGGVGGVGLAAHELRKQEGASYSGTSSGQTSGQQHTTGVPSSGTYGAGTSTAKQSASQQQYGRDSATAGGMGSSQGTSKQHYRTLSSGTPSGVDSTPFESNAASKLGSNAHSQLGSNVPSQVRSNMPSQVGSNLPSQVGSNVPSQLGSKAPGQFGSNAPAPSGQYGSNTVGQHSAMPGTFPQDTYDNTMSNTQTTAGAGVGSGAGLGSQYTTSKHGPTTVASDESGHAKLHKEPHSESLASTVKSKLGI